MTEGQVEGHGYSAVPLAFFHLFPLVFLHFSLSLLRSVPTRPNAHIITRAPLKAVKSPLTYVTLNHSYRTILSDNFL